MMDENTSAYAKPVPDLDDPLMAPFWTALQNRHLVAQRCRSCGSVRFPALPICATCLEMDLEWVDVAEHGTIWSYAVYHRAFHPGFASEIPYVVGIIENDDGVRYTGRIIGERSRVAVGRRVSAVYSDETSSFTLLKWTLDE